ncbi:hypothetical protein K431DRAFT_315852 [Polychaeton citri CBS 116435]|uniref:Glycosyltransferase family 8 protein n=1 Tax=Polychaeton citri CBS 116435 TaxID=1314669 RepID=A0A9P4Q082_9PEZI|nr:hypothetical protein K431DRAFT_315852 [Polychaeton citri CBS 116435]
MAILLTQSQVSVALSSTVVFVFTLLLFLSGYTLQKQSTTNLREAVRPRIPSPPTSESPHHPLSEQIQPSRLFGGSLGSKGRIAYQEYLRPEDKPGASVDWRRLAHVQLVKTNHEICNAIMIFGELHGLRSPARRVLLFPEEWALEPARRGGKPSSSDPYMDVSRRLLRLAARRYGVELRPVKAIAHRDLGSDGGESSLQDVYSLASAFSLTEFDRMLTLETPGLILDASPLDAVLAFTESAPFAMLHDTVTDDGVHSEDLLLLQPDAGLHEKLTSSISMTKDDSSIGLASTFESPLLLSSSKEDNALVRSIGVLHDAGASFNQTAYLQNAAYVRFWDPRLPGPEYSVPYSMKREARPVNQDADWIWTKLYGTFAQKRFEFCGLDLEHWSDD